MIPLAFLTGWNVPALVVLGFLVLAMLMLAGLHRRMTVMEKIVRQIAMGGEGRRQELPDPQDEATDRPYERFLAEDPDRKLLSKRELSAEYRKWRRQNGLNWGKG